MSKQKKDWSVLPRPYTFEEAKGTFTGRFTMEHMPDWALKPMRNRQYFAPQYRTDREWYDNTKFVGEYPSSNGKACLSTNMSYPLGETLSEPYKINQVDERDTIN